MYHYFYKIINKHNLKFYYGVHSTDNLNDNYMGSGTIIKRLVKKFGKDSFEKRILKFFKNEEEMFDYEKKFITEDIINDPNCYNLVNGGNGYQIGHIVTQEVKEKLSKKSASRNSSQKGYKYVNKNKINKMVPPNKINEYLLDGWDVGVYISAESKQKLRTSPMKGKKMSAESKLKMSLAKKGKPAHNKGIPQTEEVKKKISKTLTGFKHSKESRLKMSNSRKGKKQSEESKIKRSKALMGHSVSEETREKISLANKGKKRNKITRY